MGNTDQSSCGRSTCIFHPISGSTNLISSCFDKSEYSKIESSTSPVNVTPLLLLVSVNTGLCLPPPSVLHFLLLLWASCDIEQRRSCSTRTLAPGRPDSCLLDLTLDVSLSMFPPSLSFIRYKDDFCNSDPLKN